LKSISMGPKEYTCPWSSILHSPPYKNTLSEPESAMALQRFNCIVCFYMGH
jgi:hypothetical protein